LGQEGFAGTDGAMPTYPSYGISAIILYGCSSRDYNLKRRILKKYKLQFFVVIKILKENF
jgi:hypothetical protein